MKPKQQSKWQRYIFRYRNSDQVAGEVTATSFRQAVYKLKMGGKCGAIDVDEAIDTGLIHLHRTTSASAPVQKRVRKRLADERFERLKKAGVFDWWDY